MTKTKEQKQSQVAHYLVSGGENYEKELKPSGLTVRIKSFAASFSGFGFLLFFVGLVMLMAAEEEYERPIRIIGWGMFFAGLGPIFPLHILILRATESRKRKAVYGVMIAALYGFLVNSLFLGTYADGVLCQPWYPGYDPDAGNCPCDERTLLETNDPPVFVSRDDYVFPGKIRIATIGDTSLKEGKKVMQLAQSKGIDLFVVNGDLTYEADPQAFDDTLTEIFGENFPVMITVGNHDTGIYTEYQKVMQDRYERYRRSVEGINPVETLLCDGMLGVSERCSFYNMALFFNGLGSTCSTDEFLNQDLRDALSYANEENALWRLVYIHKNQRLLQTGGKRDEVGTQAFENSIEYGALVHNSHEHTYARTKELYGIGTKESDFIFIAEEDQEFLNNKELINIGTGASAVVANGLGGKSIRDAEGTLAENPWWSRTFHDASEGINYGVHVCEYGVDEIDALAYCYFETVDGFIADEYYVRSNN